METARLNLRQRNREQLLEVFHQPLPRQLEFFGYESREALEYEVNKLKANIGNNKIDATRWWDLVEKSNGKVVGSGGFHNWLPEHERAELGYALHEPYREKGYMLEALSRMLTHGFREMKLNRVEAFIGPENLPSQKIIAKLGFTKEGTLRQHYKSGNKIYDSDAYSMLRSEYDKIQAL